MNCESCPYRESCTVEMVNGVWLCTAQRQDDTEYSFGTGTSDNNSYKN